MDSVDGMIRAAIVGFLEKQDGAQFTLASISSQIKLGVAAVRVTLATLEEQGIVRRVTGERHARFYIPTAAQIAAHMAAMDKLTVRRDRPLQPRPHHAERIAQIRAQREAFPSKFTMEGK